MGNLIPNFGNVPAVVEEEVHCAVVGAVGVLLQEGEGEGGAAVVVVAVFIPDSAGTDEIIPEGMAGDDFAALGGDEVAAVLHKLNIDIG